MRSYSVYRMSLAVAIGGGAGGGGAEGAVAPTCRQGGKRYQMPPILQT